MQMQSKPTPASTHGAAQRSPGAVTGAVTSPTPLQPAGREAAGCPGVGAPRLPTWSVRRGHLLNQFAHEATTGLFGVGSPTLRQERAADGRNISRGRAERKGPGKGRKKSQAIT